MKKEKEKVKIKIREENDKISRSVRKGNKWKNLLIAAVLCFSLAACGSGPAPDPAQNTDGGHPASAETSLTSETAAQAIGHPETAWTAGASGTAGRASEIASGEKTDRSAATAISSERAAAAESSERAATAIAATAAESTERTATAATAAESSESAATSAAALTSTAALEENFSREESEEIETLIREREANKDETFANAREIRNLFEDIITNQATRIAGIAEPTEEEITTILPEDLNDSDGKLEAAENKGD